MKELKLKKLSNKEEKKLNQGINQYKLNFD